MPPPKLKKIQFSLPWPPEGNPSATPALATEIAAIVV